MEHQNIHNAGRQQVLRGRVANIFCLYDGKDASFFYELKKRLHPWERQQKVAWLEISPGEARENITLSHLQRADLILLFFSADFFGDNSLYDAMRVALKERRQRQVSVVAILTRASSWKNFECSDLPALPDNNRPITLWADLDEAYEQICEGLLHLIPHFSRSLPDGTLASQMVEESVTKTFQARELPIDYVPRSQLVARLKYALLEQGGSQTTTITIALLGMGGFGKTTLALALYHDPEIQAMFPDGLFWLELGEQPSSTVTLVNRLLSVLGNTQEETVTLEEAKTRWQQILQNKRCLLVIDDVWQMAHLQPLLEGGSHCVRLVTTRNDHVLPKDTKRVVVDAMSLQEAMAMLMQGLPDEVRQESYQGILTKLVAYLGYWPLLLDVANGLLTTQLRYGHPLSQALTAISQMYKGQKNTAQLLQTNRAIDFQSIVNVCLQTSFRQLEQLGNNHSHPVERYQELVVFPEDIDIPLPVLQRFWQATGGLEMLETENLCMQLYSLSLLLICDLDKGIIRLHDVTRTYLLQYAGEQLSTLHRRFLDAQTRIPGVTRWVGLAPDETYLWNFLVWHLCQTGYRGELQATLTDLHFLANKVLYTGVPALEADLLLASTFFSTDSSESVFLFLYRKIVFISHLLQRTQTLSEVGGLLLSYVGWEPSFMAQRLSWEQKLPHPYLTAWYPFPDYLSEVPLLRTLSDHTSNITSCAVSPDNSYIVSTSDDKRLTVWDITTGIERFSIKDYYLSVMSCAVSPDGRFIVTASFYFLLQVWDANTGRLRFNLNGHTDIVTRCTVSPNGSYIVSTSDDETLKVWDANTGEERYSLECHTHYAVSPDSNYIVSVSDYGTLKVWDANTGRLRFTLKDHTSITSCTVSPDSNYIVSASWDGTLKLWDANTGRLRFTLKGHKDQVDECAMSPDGSYIVSASWDKTLKVWDANTGRLRFTLKGHTSNITSCTVSPDSSYIVSASWDGTLKLWDANTGRLRLTLNVHPGIIWTNTISYAVSPDSRFITSGASDGTLKVWDATTSEERSSYKSENGITSCAVSPNGNYIVSTSNDKTIKVWDAITGKISLTLKGHKNRVNGCAVSPDSSYIVSASWDKTLKVWNPITGRLSMTLKGHKNRVNGCAVSSDGSYIVSASADKTLRVWDANTGQERLTLKDNDRITSCAVSPDNSYIISTSDNCTFKIWDAFSGREIRTICHTSWGDSCVVSPDGKFLVVASDDCITVWDPATGRESLTLENKFHQSKSCAISPDSSYIVSASYMKTLRVWNSKTGRCLLTFPVAGALSGCAFYPDCEHLVTWGEQGIYFLRLVI